MENEIDGMESLEENLEKIKEDLDRNDKKYELEEQKYKQKCPFKNLQEVSDETKSVQVKEDIPSIPNTPNTLEDAPSCHFSAFKTNEYDTEAKTATEESKHDSDASEIPPNSEGNTEQGPVAETPLSAQPVILPGGFVMPPPRVETVNTSWKTQQLTHEQVNEYCKRLFKFKTVHIMHFK